MNRRLISLILSFIYCGFGQLYNRQIAKGIDFIIVYTILIASFFSPVPRLRLIGLSIVPFMWCVGMVDAYWGEELVFHRKKLLLGIIPGILLSLLVFYGQYTYFPGNPNVVNSINQVEEVKAFSVQVVSLQDLDRAKKLHKELSNKGYSVRIERSFSTAGQWFRVLVGNFDTAGEAALLVEELREDARFSRALVYDNSATIESTRESGADEQPD